jgi:hypothetical protein
MYIDLQLLSPLATDDALEFIYKSAARGDRGAGIWDAHESVLIRRLIELFTKRGLDRLEHVKTQLSAWQQGKHHNPDAKPSTAPGMMVRWTDDELSLVKLYLEALPPGKWGVKDHMMAVDYVVQRYLPAEELKTEAQWLATRAVLMGKVQANLDAKLVTPQNADKILAALPSTPEAAASQFDLSKQQKSAMEFAEVRAGENVRALTDKARHQLRQTVMQQLELAETTGQLPSLETELFDDFASLNRDWRRIAVTEAGECQTQGFIASLKPGTKVKRVEQYETACAFCKRIHGRVATVVAADAPDKDGETMVWPGKNNIGRSAAPRKRVGDELVPRTEAELWHLPAGLAHPNCRGFWVAVMEILEGDDPEFGAYLQKVLSGN